MTDNEQLLLNTLDDLRSRLEKGNGYNLIRASGLIRQLLIDKYPLVDVVNQKYKLEILFKTQVPNLNFRKKIIINGMEYETFLGVKFTEPGEGDEQYTDFLNRDEFLKYNVIFFDGKDFTVLDIIKLCAHKYGGIHVENPKNEKDITLDRANKTVSYKTTSTEEYTDCVVRAMKDITTITLNALEPLVKTIRNTKPGII